MTTPYIAHTALVRAYDGEPLRRLIVAAKQDVLYVLNPNLIEDYKNDLTRSIGFRRIDCFAWNEAVFRELSESYKMTGQTDDVAWSELSPFMGTPLRFMTRKLTGGRRGEVRRFILYRDELS